MESGPSDASSNGATPSVMSPGKSARFSELVSIITSTAGYLHEEFDFISPDSWNDILEHMFPADGRADPSGESREILTILENEAARKAKQLEKTSKAPVFGNGSAPPAEASAHDISDEQRKNEWSLIVRYGDPRASMSDEHFAGLRVAIRRWWNLSMPLEVLKLARNAATAQYKIVGSFGPGMSPFNTAIWHKALYDEQCKYLDHLIQQGDGRGVTAMEAFLGRLPALRAPAQNDDVVSVRQATAAPKTAARKTSSPMTQPAAKATSRKRRKTKQDPQFRQDDSDSDSGGSVVKRQRRTAAQKAPVIDIPDSPDEFQTVELNIQSLTPKIKTAPLASELKAQSRANRIAPGAITSHPKPLAPSIKQDAPRKKKKYVYKIEAELTQCPRTNSLISFLVSMFWMKNRKLLVTSPWAMEKLRHYAQGKEPHLKGPRKTSMLEIGFFEGKDLSWTLTGFQLDHLTNLREKAKVEWMAENTEHDIAATMERTKTERLLETHGDTAEQSNADNDAVTAETANNENGSGEKSTDSQDITSAHSDTVTENKGNKSAEDLYISDCHEDEQTVTQDGDNDVPAPAAGNDEGRSTTTSGKDEELDMHSPNEVSQPATETDQIIVPTQVTRNDDAMSDTAKSEDEDVGLEPANKASTPVPAADLFELFTTINDSPHASTADAKDAAAASQLLPEQQRHQQYIRSSLSPEHTFCHANTTPTTAIDAFIDTQDAQMQTTCSTTILPVSSSSLSSRPTTLAASSNSDSGAAASDQHVKYKQDVNDNSSGDKSEWHDAIPTMKEI